MLKRLRALSLFSRVCLHGLFVLLASASAFIALGAFLLRPALEQRMLDAGAWIAPSVCDQLTKGEAIHGGPTELQASAYAADGTLLGSLATPPVPALSAARVAQLRAQKVVIMPDAPLHAFWCSDTPGGAYVELVPVPPAPGRELALPIAAALVVVALASIPLARSIARPLAELVRVSQAFGRGELAIRTTIARADEVGELARAFNHMADRLQCLIVAEQELLANVSHELRTPLARIRVVLETAQENPLRAQVLLHEINSDLGDLERLVETVMETMRLETHAATSTAGLSLVRLEALDLVSAAREAAKRFAALHPARAIELDLRAPQLEVDADPRLLRHLLDNLLENAHKYSDEAAPISLRVLEEGRAAERGRLEVIDRGVGIDEADLPHVFEPFFRGQGSRARAAGGAGLGLALAKRIVDAHSGGIEISSTLGVGTQVRIALRRRQISS